jgi:hypothetical protein
MNMNQRNINMNGNLSNMKGTGFKGGNTGMNQIYNKGINLNSCHINQFRK